MQQNEETPRSTSPAARHDSAHKRSGGAGIRFALICVALFGGLLILGLLPRLKLAPKLENDAAEAKSAPPIVTYLYAKQSPASSTLELPGTVDGAEETAISARASGYLKKWYVDIGDHVKAGQLLAVIETPDADQSTVQAKAQYVSSEASAQQAHANTYMQIANADQAVANVSKAVAAYDQSKSDLAHSQVAEAQAKQQADQAQAQLVSAQASLALAKKTSDRYEDLAKQGAIDQQTADQDYSAYLNNKANVQALEDALAAAKTNVQAAHETTLSSVANEKAMLDSVTAAKAALIAARQNVAATRSGESAAVATANSNQANFQRTAILQGFQKVTAPFDGIITARNVDNGALVTAAGGVSSTTGLDQINTGSSTTSSASTSLFDMVRTNMVRIYINVPEMVMGGVRPGETVHMTVSELGNADIVGTVGRDSSAIDQASRTLLTQIDVSNKDGRLRPGMYVTVKLTVPEQHRALRIPDTALIVDSLGTRVAVVTAQNTIHFQNVIVGRDYGKEMDVTAGLSQADKLVSNPTNLLTEGITVKAEQAKVMTKAGTAPAAASPAPSGQPGSDSPSGGSAPSPGASGAGGMAEQPAGVPANAPGGAGAPAGTAGAGGASSGAAGDAAGTAGGK